MTLFNAIMTDGVYEYYKRRRKKYLYPGDGRKYWAMPPTSMRAAFSIGWRSRTLEPDGIGIDSSRACGRR